MLGRLRRPAPAPAADPGQSNASLQTVPVFGVDPHGAAIGLGAVNGTLGRLSSRVVIDRHDNAWTGWVQQPQGFRGTFSAGAARPVLDPTTMLDQSASSAGLSPMQVTMEQRAARGRY